MARAQARKSYPIKKDPAASAFWVYFESRLERYPHSTSHPLWPAARYLSGSLSRARLTEELCSIPQVPPALPASIPTPENLYYPPKRGDYTYFETPPYQLGESPKVSLARAADASLLAYARFVQQRMALADLQGILATAGYPAAQPIGDCFVDGANAGRGYFAYNDSHALLAIRGTEADNNKDKAADAEIDRTPESGALVHSGFKRYLDSVWGQVTQCVAGYRANHPNQNICITGHSLGGALATLAFTRLNDPASSLITFGCPRVGNPAYCNVVLPRRVHARAIASSTIWTL